MTFSWNLSQPKFFQKFADTARSPTELNTKSRESENLIDISDGVYYYWRSSTKTIIKAHSSDIWDADDIDPPYEQWMLSSPLPFHATNLSVRRVPKEVCLLWGPLGAAVVTFHSTMKNERIATCEIIGAMSYIMNPRLNILSAKWHPSTAQSVVIILNNDNYIRSYSPEDPSVCILATPAGPLDSVQFQYSKRNSASFDATVHFDFGPYLCEYDFWPVFLLKSSGTISYLLMKFIGRTNRSVWEEEKIIPIDGELEDILEQPVTISVGKVFPLLITIAGLGGSLYHTMLLPAETDLTASDAVDLEKSLVSGDTILLVKEVVVLESEDQLSFIHIIPDPICSYRYACLHQEGIHIITVNFVPHLMKFLSSKGKMANFNDASLSATCIYLICSKDGTKEKNSDSVKAVFSDCVPQKFVAVTSNGETLVSDIPKFSGTELVCSDNDIYDDTPKSSKATLNALEKVTSILSRTSNQPYLACSPSLSSEKKEGVILDSIKTLQKEYIYKQEQALKFLTAGASNLQDRIQEIRDPLVQLQKDQPHLRTKAEELAEMYEELNDIQRKLFKRFQSAMSSHHRSLSLISDEERKWASRFKEYDLDLPQIKDQVESLTLLARDWAVKENDIQRFSDTGSPRPKMSAMELLNVKREVIQHQRTLAELSQSLQEINDNISQ